MSNNRDLIVILSIVLLGMFIPFIGSITITYGLNLMDINNLIKLFSTFGYFLLIFGIEIGFIYIYFNITNKFAKKDINKYKHK